MPYLLTSSIARNLYISEIFSETIRLSPDQIKCLVMNYPFVAMSNADVIKGSWSLITDLYGIDHIKARSIVAKYPLVSVK